MAPAVGSTVLVSVGDPDWARALSCSIRRGQPVVCAPPCEALSRAKQLRPGLVLGAESGLMCSALPFAPAVVLVKHGISSGERQAAIELGAYAVLDTASAEWPTKLQRIVEVCIEKGRLAEPAIAPVLRLVPPQPARGRRASK